MGTVCVCGQNAVSVLARIHWGGGGRGHIAVAAHVFAAFIEAVFL